ncbi:base excision DNA repair protein [candidate division LCP-89 bacterium B3_LCP]|uniref:Base excision DNA repair protein n=1 Tax=candidate division LCP-89 bacterium B3_LCP TaxID=2012998 RepID=A0A532V4J9_UNCL8|nr:MAG: base excision DNA repair protein [candidate division LCP-89 bacterium B3_LCP]
MERISDNLQARLERITGFLEKEQSVKTWPGPSEPLDSLILTILSQNTNDNLRDRAYDNLRSRFPQWMDVHSTPVEEIAQLIRIAGLSQQKSKRIKEILEWVKEEFEGFSLKALENVDDDEALKLLTSRKGIGIKTAAVVLMATLGRDLCPVDTHVHRIAKRLGWVLEKINAEKTFWQLRPHVPEGKGYSLHMNLLQFGRTICSARKPLCSSCYLWADCIYPQKGTKK